MTATEGIVSNFKKAFIVGCARSGTTWLNQMISQHPNVISPDDETHVYKLIYSPFTHVLKANFSRRLKSWRLFGRYYGILGILRGVTEDDLYRGILNIYRVYEQKSDVGLHHLISYEELKGLIEKVRKQPYTNIIKSQIIIDRIFTSYCSKREITIDDIFLEKTPEHIFHLKTILQCYPQAKVIDVVRDGRDVHASWQAIAQTKWWFRKDNISIIDRWNKSIEATEKFIDDSRIYRIKYEDLRKNTNRELAKIFEFLELKASSQFIDNIIDDLDISKVKNKGVGQYINKGKIGNWQEVLSTEDISLWNELASKNLRKLGYI